MHMQELMYTTPRSGSTKEYATHISLLQHLLNWMLHYLMIIIHSFVIAPFLTAQLAEAERLRKEDDLKFQKSCEVCMCVLSE